MSYEIDPLILYSQDRTRMLNFLSDVFEFEVNEQDFLVYHQGMAFKVMNIENCSSQIPHDSSVAFSFRLQSIDQFNEIINKYKFFKYRRGESSSEQIEIFENEMSSILVINDIDRRPWRFELKRLIAC